MPTPPTAPQHPTTTTLHGDTRVDQYAWLANSEDPKVIAYLEAENAYAHEILAPRTAAVETLYEEIRSHVNEDDRSIPARHGNYEY